MRIKKTMTINVYADSGHAWAKVARLDLIALQLCGEISSSSYQRGEYVYLEEDSDLTLFIDRLKERNEGIVIKFKESHTNRRSKIRDYESFYSPIKTFISSHFIYQRVGN
jgi:hypothetical protein